jgi:tRNA(fMet)-specific endonuclease VapC
VALGDGDVAVTIISFEEQARGWLTYLARARPLPQQVEAYARLRRMVENYRVIPCSISIYPPLTNSSV